MLNEKNISELLSTCISIEITVSLVTCFTTKDDSNDEGLLCTICEYILKHNFENGLSLIHETTGLHPFHPLSNKSTSATKESFYRKQGFM